MINFIKFGKIGSSISIILLFLSFFFLYSRGINFGIDFTGGVLIETKCENIPTKSEIKSIIDDFEKNNEKIIVQTDAHNGVIIKLQTN